MLVPSYVPLHNPRGKDTPLSETFEPGDFDVQCGRGKKSFHSTGNRRFRLLITLHLGRYLQARTKLDKSLVVVSIIDMIRSHGGGFVKQIKNKWVDIGDRLAREKVGHALRDTIGTKNANKVSLSLPFQHEAFVSSVQGLMKMSSSDLVKYEQQLTNPTPLSPSSPSAGKPSIPGSLVSHGASPPVSTLEKITRNPRPVTTGVVSSPPTSAMMKKMNPQAPVAARLTKIRQVSLSSNESSSSSSSANNSKVSSNKYSAAAASKDEDILLSRSSCCATTTTNKKNVPNDEVPCSISFASSSSPSSSYALPPNAEAFNEHVFQMIDDISDESLFDAFIQDEFLSHSSTVAVTDEHKNNGRNHQLTRIPSVAVVSPDSIKSVGINNTSAMGGEAFERFLSETNFCPSNERGP